jgi:DNA-binding HxlR family transcriptional regulator
MAGTSPLNTLRVADGVLPREEWPAVNDHCAIAQMLGVISTKTAFLVLREAFYGATRFDQFAERAQISEPVAAARLKELTMEGLLEKVPYREPGQRTRFEYVLTDKGADLLPTLLAMWNWGDRWIFDGGGRIEFRHRDCDAPIRAVLACEAGHTVSPAEIELHARRRT